MTLQNLETIAAISSIGISSLALLVSCMAYFHTKAASVTETYLSLRDRFLSIYSQFPAKIKDKDYSPEEGSEDWQLIEAYWYHVFDEWFLTVKIKNKHLTHLWDSFFKHVIASSMGYSVFRLVLKKMYDSGSSFGGYREEFYNQLVSLRPERPLK